MLSKQDYFYAKNSTKLRISFMALSKKPYRGTRDFFPTEKRIQDYMFKLMQETAEQFGYEPYDGPLLEEVELYKAKSGEELINDQIYSFTDRGDRFVAIRPEMTPTLARMVASIHKETPKPIRWYAIPNLMRYEKPQKGRLREHWQFNCDIFGAPEDMGELEILQVAVSLLKRFGAKKNDFEILLNDRSVVDLTFSTLMNLDKETAYKLYKIVDRFKKVPRDAFDKMVNELDLSGDARCIFFEYLALTNFGELCEFLKKHQQLELADRIENLKHHMEELFLSDFVVYDPTIVRGLDYYTGIVFEIFDKHPDNRRAICGGGSYANLLKIFNEDPLPGTGFGLGDVTLRDFLETHKLLPDFSTPDIDLLITFQDEKAKVLSMKIANLFRKLGLNVVTHPELLKFKKVFPMAEKKGARFVGMLGSQELVYGTIQVKNMKTKEQHVFEHTKIDAFFEIFKGSLNE